MKQVKELMNLDGRIALITGGAGYLGMAMAHALSELGANIILVDRDNNALDRAADELTNTYNNKITKNLTDLENDDEVIQLLQRIGREHEKLDILINNAAFAGAENLQGWVTPFENQTITTWRRAIEVNLTRAFELTQACLPLLRASNHGSVVNIGSIYGVLGPDLSLYEETNMGNPAAYAASKGGLIQLSRWMATILAPDIRVNVISPGGIFRGQPKSFVDKYIARTPLKRMAREEDFKGVISYLASDLSAYVTGQNILVDGGWSAW